MRRHEDTTNLVQEAAAGDAAATRALIAALTPLIKARVHRALRRRSSVGRDVQQEIDDLTQDVFAALFSRDARVLRAWDPTRGLSLNNWVGMVAEREVSSIMRSHRRSPWTEEPTECDTFARSACDRPCPETRAVGRQVLEQLLGELRGRLSGKGRQMFALLMIEQRSVEEICTTTGLKRDAVYAWRSRLAKLAREVQFATAA